MVSVVTGVDKAIILILEVRIMRCKGVLADVFKYKLVRGRAETGTVLPGFRSPFKDFRQLSMTPLKGRTFPRSVDALSVYYNLQVRTPRI